MCITGENSVIDAWKFLEHYHKTMIINIKVHCWHQQSLVMVTKRGQGKPIEIYKPLGYPDVTMIDISDDLDWDDDEYYPYETRGRKFSQEHFKKAKSILNTF